MRKLFITFAPVLALFLCVSCEKVDELPEINEQGYKQQYRMPDPTLLNDEDRQVINNQEQEHDANVPS